MAGVFDTAPVSNVCYFQSIIPSFRSAFLIFRFGRHITSIYEEVTYMVVRVRFLPIKSCKMKLRRTLGRRCPERTFTSDTRRSLVSLVPWQGRSRKRRNAKPNYLVKFFLFTWSGWTEKTDALALE